MNNDYTPLFIKYYRKNITVFQLLIRLFNINKSLALIICREIGINPYLNIYFFNNINFNSLINKLEFYLKMVDSSKSIFSKKESLLKRMTYLNQLKNIKSFRYFRLKNGLPVNGQRTHSNGRTAKLKLNFHD